MINIGIDAFLDSQPETVKVKKERHNCTGCAMVFDTVKGVRSHFIRSHRPKAKRWIPKVFKPKCYNMKLMASQQIDRNGFRLLCK